MKDNQLVIEEFLKHKENNNKSRREQISPRTMNGYRRDLEGLIKTVNNKPFKDITQEDIESYLKGYKLSTKNHCILFFRDFFRWLYNLDEGDRLPDVVRKLKAKKVEVDDMAYSERVITPEEYNAVLEGCNKPMHKALFEALWITGARKEEIQTLRVGDVSYDGHYTSIKIRVSKTQSREVIYPNRAEHLLKWRESLSPVRDNPNEPLFQTRYGNGYRPIDSGYTWDILNTVCQRMKLRHIKVHDFRHTRATMLLKEGTPETHVKTLLGWTKNSSMLRVYDHNKIKDYKDWMDRKNRNIKPTYELLERQKKDLETKHEREIKELQEKIALLGQQFTDLVKGVDGLHHKHRKQGVEA
jgi:site-specific recombinase XerD